MEILGYVVFSHLAENWFYKPLFCLLYLPFCARWKFFSFFYFPIIYSYFGVVSPAYSYSLKVVSWLYPICVIGWYRRYITIPHEFNHSFVNSLYDANAVLLDSIGKTLLGRHYRGMSSQAYGNAATVINESVVRAAVIIYMQDNGFAYDQVKKEMCAQIGRDFLWMPELVVCKV